MNTIDEIKAAVDAGKTVHWSNEGYRVIKDKIGQYLIGWNIGGRGENYVGLTWTDNVTSSYDPAEFFIAEEPAATAEGRYTLVMSGDALMLCVPDGTDLQAELNKLCTSIAEDPLDLAACHVEEGLILTDEEPEDRARIRWRGHSLGAVGDIHDRTYEYAIEEE